MEKLCIHTITTKPWAFEPAMEAFAKAGVKGVTVWPDAIDHIGPKAAGELIRSHGMKVVSYCRGGFFPSADEERREMAIQENLMMIEAAAEIGAPSLVLVCGAEPKQPLEVSRDQIRAGIERILPHAEERGVKLSIEPLHPMYADTRSAINTLRQANEMAEQIKSPWVGVAVDVYHLWWDPELEAQIRRCGENNNLFAFHICDWSVPTSDMLLDRGLMGDGCINVKQIRKWVEDTGYEGFNEVEIFSNKYWAMDQQEFLDKIIHAYKHYS